MKTAKLSPRQVDDVVYWYEGNTFTWNIKFDITDVTTQQPFVIEAGDIVTISFKRNENDCTPVYEFTFNNIENNKVSMRFDSEITALFPRGEYVIGATFNGVNITTLIDASKVVVERSVDNGCSE